ncbi:MAG: hypothetical protein WBW33_19925 [Bryobacteraceae bacterium]
MIVYEKIVKAAADAVLMEPDSALSDGPGMITPGIFRQIRHSHVIVADMTGENTCVGYELAFAHTLARCTVLLVRGDGKLPFDLRDMNRIKYDHEDAASIKKAKDDLVAHVREFAKTGWASANNPIFHAAFAPPDAASINQHEYLGFLSGIAPQSPEPFAKNLFSTCLGLGDLTSPTPLAEPPSVWRTKK